MWINRTVAYLLSSLWDYVVNKGHITLVPIVKFKVILRIYSYQFLHLHSTKWTEFRDIESRLTPFTIDLQLISYCIKRWLNALCWSKCWCLVGYIEAILLDWKPSANVASRFDSWIIVMRDGAILVTVITSWLLPFKEHEYFTYHLFYYRISHILLHDAFFFCMIIHINP
jgi:hypothetical protein